MSTSFNSKVTYLVCLRFKAKYILESRNDGIKEDIFAHEIVLEQLMSLSS